MYDKPVNYKSPLRVYENLPSLVVYKCSQTEAVIGKVYKTPEEKWFLATRYIGHWQPLEVSLSTKVSYFSTVFTNNALESESKVQAASAARK